MWNSNANVQISRASLSGYEETPIKFNLSSESLFKFLKAKLTLESGLAKRQTARRESQSNRVWKEKAKNWKSKECNKINDMLYF